MTFEEFAIEKNWNIQIFKGGRFPGEYIDGTTQAASEAWQASERDIREQLGQRWIPVEEKLPEPDIWVIGLHEHDGKQHVAPAYGKMTGTPRRTFHFQSEFPVTHWMPLPDPPLAERVRGKGAQ